MTQNETPSPTILGLCTFGLVTILLSLANAGLIGVSSPIIAMAVFCGGFALVIVGLLEWTKNNLFGFITFGGFGFFWFSFAAILVLPAMGLAAAPTAIELGAFLFVWTLLALCLLICGLHLGDKLLLAILAFLVLLFVLLTFGALLGIPLLTTLGGYAGIITGLLALYMGIALVVNTVCNKSIFPL
ncbi:MAG: acetate uptake transporter [Methanomicrobiales archaeon]|jgi:succinate-acetate transporter protein|nr:acetate uptake transporter [Methanomicrobiales archaeon]